MATPSCGGSRTNFSTSTWYLLNYWTRRRSIWPISPRNGLMRPGHEFPIPVRTGETTTVPIHERYGVYTSVCVPMCVCVYKVYRYVHTSISVMYERTKEYSTYFIRIKLLILYLHSSRNPYVVLRTSENIVYVRHVSTPTCRTRHVCSYGIYSSGVLRKYTYNMLYRSTP